MILQDLVVGRGELHLNLFEPGTKAGKGERYLGNTPGFALSVREDALVRKGVHKGLKVTTDRYVKERSYEGDITSDQIGMQNLSLWFGSTAQMISVDATGSDPAISENIVVTRGMGYQLGMVSHPLGHRFLTDIVFKIGSTVISESGNVLVDADRGRFNVYPDAADIDDGMTLTIEYKTSGYVRRYSNAPQRALEGALRFVSFNFVGRKNDLYFPWVSIEPKGAIDLKTSDWQTIQYSMTVMKLPGKELFYAANAQAGAEVPTESFVYGGIPFEFDGETFIVKD